MASAARFFHRLDGMGRELEGIAGLAGLAVLAGLAALAGLIEGRSPLPHAP